MSDRTEFDDLARRKLEEREFAFDQAAWNDMERMLHGKRRNRRGWWITAALLLLIGTGTWWTLHSSGTNEVAEAPAAVPHERTPSVPGTPAAPSEGPTSPTEQAIVPNTPTAPASTEQAVPGTTTTNTPEAVTTSVAEPTAVRAAAPRATRTTPAAVTTAPLPNAPLPSQDGSTSTVSDRPPVGDTTPSEPVVNEGVNAPPQEPAMVPSDPDLGPVAIGVLPTTADALPAAPPSGDPIVPANTSEEPLSTVIDPATSTNASTAPLVVNDSTPIADSTIALVPNVQDTASVAPGPAPVPPLVDPRAPWEISALGGMFMTNTSYSGGRSEAWASDVTGERTVGFGAEVMHMGPNIGFGGGVHYSSYAERIDAQELSMTETTFFDSNYFVPVDTTILVVHGMFFNGEWYYQTHQLDTTINVLVLDQGSTTTTAVRRTARSRTNTTSYLEMPLLFDAHLVQGPWALGVRGGPTLGVLQGRTGSLPNEELNGYSELEDVAFRSLVIGWTARAYIRYRFSDAWSLGLEPTARGQLFNALEGDDLTRRASAWGGFFSVNYRLR